MMLVLEASLLHLQLLALAVRNGVTTGPEQRPAQKDSAQNLLARCQIQTRTARLQDVPAALSASSHQTT